MVAIYPAAYRTAVAVALGGARGAPGGVIGFVGGAVLTAAYLAWQLSKDKPYNPPLIDAPREGFATAEEAAASENIVYEPIPNPALHGWTMEIDCDPAAAGPGATTGDWSIWPGTQHTCWVQQGGIWHPWDPDLIDPDFVHQDVHAGWLNGFPHRQWTYKIYSHEGTGNLDLKNEPLLDAPSMTVRALEVERQKPVSYAESPGSDRGYTNVIPVRRSLDRHIRLAAGINLASVQSRPAVRAVALTTTSEVKLHIRMFGLPIGVEFLGALFEALDLIDAMYRGLGPEGKDLQNPNSLEKLDFIIQNLDKIDWEVVARVIEDQMQDFAIGLQGKVLAGMGRSAGLPFGLGTILGASN